MSSEFSIINGSDTLIVSFAGDALQFGGIPPFEFYQFLNKHFSNLDKYFFIDHNRKHYHKGIVGISKNIEETLQYLKNIIKNYKKVIFIGNSAGGYAAILFGSLLNVNIIIAFIPQTILKLNSDFDEKYLNLKDIINNYTKYYIYGDLSARDSLHHINHINNLEGFSNINIIKKNCVKLKEMRNSGELVEIFKNIIEKNE